MLFNSATFIIGFLPVVLLGFFLFAGTGRQRLAGLWLTLASLVFYGWWDPHYVPLLVGSMAANYLLGGWLLKHPSRLVLVLGIAGNLLLLGYYKYTGFLLGAVDGALGLGWDVPNIILPLAISFFTFQQIAYLSDAHDGAVVEHDFLNYCLFITFFPHLIAGPITGPVSDQETMTAPGTRVVQSWEVSAAQQNAGVAEFTYRVARDAAPMYLRVRGTDGNRASGGASGLEPEMDVLGDANPWEDLWFYSNPVFITR